MAYISGEVTIAAPIEEVFDLVADERNEPKYNRRIVSAQNVSEGPVGKGARFTAQPKGMGASGTMTLEILEYARPHRLHNVVRSSYVLVDGTLNFTELHDQTLLRWDWNMTLAGPMRVLSPVLALVARVGSVATRWISGGISSRVVAEDWLAKVAPIALASPTPSCPQVPRRTKRRSIGRLAQDGLP